MKIKIFIGALACLVIQNVFANAEEDVHQLLGQAILCGPEPINSVNKLVMKGSSFSNGYATHTFGFGMDYKSIVILKSPLVIEQSSANAVIVDLTGLEMNFKGYVYAQFTGDYKKAVAGLKLKPSTISDPNSRVGDFERELKLNEPGGSEGSCPRIIALTPQPDNKFLLGCGWLCN